MVAKPVLISDVEGLSAFVIPASELSNFPMSLAKKHLIKTPLTLTIIVRSINHEP